MTNGHPTGTRRPEATGPAGGMPLDPAWREAAAARARQVAVDLEGNGVHGVAITWVDTSGITRAKAVPLRRLPHAAAWGVGVTPAFDAFLVDDSMVSGRYAGGPVGDLRMHPDLSRITPLAASPGWAWAPGDRYRQDGRPYPLDPRGVLRAQTARLAARGLVVRTAFEVEWELSRGDGTAFMPGSHGPAYGMMRLTEQAGMLSDLLSALDRQAIPVEQVHPEYNGAQFELSVAAEDPVGAADTYVLVRETVRALVRAHGLRATFAPRTSTAGAGNGAHVHMSLWRTAARGGRLDGATAGGSAAEPRNLMTGGDRRHGLTADGEAFVSGILARLPALLALLAPSAASHLRLVPSHWAGAFSCWGLENREATVRLVTGATGQQEYAANVEIKCVDASANPYTALAGLLAAGMVGLDRHATLPPPVQVDPAEVDPTGWMEHGIRPLPATPRESAAALEGDPDLVAALGAGLVDTIAAVRRGEAATFDGVAPEQVIERTRWCY